jgi:nicotinate-nucleotide pyrophosphorylase (carboxylating)
MIKATQVERDNLDALLAIAVPEDVGTGDVTSGLLPETARLTARFVARQEMVFCGGEFLQQIASAYGDIKTDVLVADGTSVRKGQVLATWEALARVALPAERVALNFLQRLSGIATLTQSYVRAIEGTGATIVDTRKTTPGWRALEKYAVRAGGGANHRIGLYDAVLVKDNHLVAMVGEGVEDPISALSEPIAKARAALPAEGFVEIEVDTLEQLASALKMDVDIVLLDNMSPATMVEAVAMRDKESPKVQLEASGGVTLETVRGAAETGVERIAIGALTHSATAVDIGLDEDIR